MQGPAEAKSRASILNRLNQLVSSALLVADHSGDEDVFDTSGEKGLSTTDEDVKVVKRKKEGKKGLPVLDQVRVLRVEWSWSHSLEVR